MTITLFSQLGKFVDGIFNWFFNLSSIWQLIFFILIVGIGIFLYYYARGR